MIHAPTLGEHHPRGTLVGVGEGDFEMTQEDIPSAWETFKRAIREDPEYAWSWHCNLAVPIMDAAAVSHEKANLAAAYLMSALWEHDITKNRHYQYGKSDAQATHEMWMALDRDSDAGLAEDGLPAEPRSGGSAGPQAIARKEVP